MDIFAAVGPSEKLILLGIGALVGGILGIFAIKARLVPAYPVKWGVIIIGIIAGIILILTGILKA